jgi:hypothetical protein
MRGHSVLGPLEWQQIVDDHAALGEIEVEWDGRPALLIETAL